MKSLKNYYTSIIRYDFINKFNYKKLTDIPILKKIILNFGCKSSDLKLLSTCSLALELVSGQKSSLTSSKNANILLKIRKGNPVGCKVILRKEYMFSFLSKLIIEIIPKFKNINLMSYNDKSKNTTSISFRINNILIFSELEKNYRFFNNVTNLQITFLINTRTKKELVYFIKCLKLPLM